MGCWLVRGDVAPLGAVTAGGGLVLEVRGCPLSVLPSKSWWCKAFWSSAGRALS